MRVIAGSARGRTLKSPPNSKIRPTADRIKEALFSTLISRLGNISGLSVLDICAGTGNLGIEALSRGASRAIFVDSDHLATELIKTNLQTLGFQHNGIVLKMTAARAVNYLQDQNEPPFNLVFFDPPYKLNIPPEVLLQLSAKGILSEQAIVVVEQDRRATLADNYGSLHKFDQRFYGDTALFFYSPVPNLITAVSDETINA